MTILAKVGRGLFGAAVACTLALGAAEAAASPPAAGSDAALCYPGACHRECREHGWASGRCVSGYCECWE